MYHKPSIPPSGHNSMSVSGIQGQLLEVTVVGCFRLKDTEWISRQDPYVCVEYGSSRSRTRTCTDGGKNPTFQEKFVFSLIEGLREINVLVWNSNSVTRDDFIGSGKVQLQKVLSQGYDDSTWPLQSKLGKHAGEVRLIMHYANANANANAISQKPGKAHAPSAPPNGAPQVSMYSAPPPAAAAHYPPAAYPAPSPYPSCPPDSGAYPPSAYPPPHFAPYPPQPYASPAAYPYPDYPPQPYPPPPQGSPYYPPGPYPGSYPPPPY